MTALSCAVAGRCVASGDPFTGTSAVLAQYADGAWTTAASSWLAEDLSCPTVTDCVAVQGDTARYLANGVWSVAQPLIIDPTDDFYLSSVSCSSRDFCAAVVTAGGQATIIDFDGTSVAAATNVTSTEIDGVSCYGVDLCAATDPQGERPT